MNNKKVGTIWLIHYSNPLKISMRQRVLKYFISNSNAIINYFLFDNLYNTGYKEEPIDHFSIILA